MVIANTPDKAKVLEVGCNKNKRVTSKLMLPSLNILVGGNKSIQIINIDLIHFSKYLL